MTGNSLLRILILLTVVTVFMGFLLFAQTPAQTQIFGGSGGDSFQDNSIPPDARILEIRISSGKFVDSVQLVYILPNGRTVLGPVRGGSGGQASVFRLDSDEHIIGLSGRYGQNIDSLRIHTNKRTSSLYGGEGGRQDYRIDVPSGNQVLGFVGRAGQYLDAVGLSYAPVYSQMAGQSDIFGGSGGSAFTDKQIPTGARISEVRVHAGTYVDGIQAIYTLPNGSIFEGPMHGGAGGKRNVFHLDSGEYITGISGRHGEYVDSLRIHTNRRTSHLWGGSGGRQEYRIDIPAGNQAVSFIGRCGKYLDAIGLAYAAAGNPAKGFFRRRP